MEFKDRIKELRNEKSMSPSQLGAAMNKSEGAVRGWDTGRTKPDYNTLIKLAKYFGVSLDYLSGLSNIRAHEEAQKDKLINEMTDKIIEYEENSIQLESLIKNQLLPGLMKFRG